MRSKDYNQVSSTCVVQTHEPKNVTHVRPQFQLVSRPAASAHPVSYSTCIFTYLHAANVHVHIDMSVCLLICIPVSARFSLSDLSLSWGETMTWALGSFVASVSLQALIA